VKYVGSYEAKTHLFRLLSQVEQGETITITKRGRPIARIVPATDSTQNTAALVEEMLAYRDGHGPALGDDLTIRQLIDEGRRFGVD
jgi:prevent-host-death family protein